MRGWGLGTRLARTRAFHIPMHIAFLLLAHAFAHVLVNPAISNVEDVLYTLGHYTGIAILSHVSIITLHKSIMTGLLPVLAQNFFKVEHFHFKSNYTQ